MPYFLISDGFLRNEKMYDEAMTLKVRLHSIAISEQAEFFNCPNYMDLNSFVASIVAKNGRKYMIENEEKVVEKYYLYDENLKTLGVNYNFNTLLSGKKMPIDKLKSSLFV